MKPAGHSKKTKGRKPLTREERALLERDLVIAFAKHNQRHHTKNRVAGGKAAHRADIKAKEKAVELAGEFREREPHARPHEGIAFVQGGLAGGGFRTYTGERIRLWIAHLWPADLRRPGRPKENV